MKYGKGISYDQKRYKNNFLALLKTKKDNFRCQFFNYFFIRVDQNLKKTDEKFQLHVRRERFLFYHSRIKRFY